MRLESEFIRLPLSFDVETLQREALQFSEYEWDYHPQRYDGNTALNLVSSGGGRTDSYVGIMQATEALQKCPYVKQVMASFKTVIGRSRFMRLAPGKGVPAHSDTDYTWRNRVRIHVPIVTDPAIIFSSTGRNTGGAAVNVHMQAGEAWIFDNWREHAVYNDSDIQRIHLVIDTVGTAEFWNLASRGLDPGKIESKSKDSEWLETIHSVERMSGDSEQGNSEQADAEQAAILFERFNQLPVRGPDEVNSMLIEFLADISYLGQVEQDRFQHIEQLFKQFIQDWRAHWALYWDSAENISRYQLLVKNLKNTLLDELTDTYLQSNQIPAFGVISNWLDATTDTSAQRQSSEKIENSGDEAAHAPVPYAGKIPNFDRPVFIVAAPRSGSTMLFEALKNNKDVWTIGDESHQEFESIKSLHPANRGFESNALAAEDCNEEVKQSIVDAFMFRLQNVRSAPYADMPSEFQPSSIRFLEKTPKNALRIPFLKAMFPKARFVFLHRRAEANIASIIDAWISQKFVTYAELPEWAGPEATNLKWSMLLSPGWRDFNGKKLAAIAAHQWVSSNEKIVSDLLEMPGDDYHVLSYEGLLNDPHSELKSACQFMDLPFGPKMQSFAKTGFPNSRYTIGEPSVDKWRRHQHEIESVKDIYAGVQEKINTIQNS